MDDERGHGTNAVEILILSTYYVSQLYMYVCSYVCVQMPVVFKALFASLSLQVCERCCDLPWQNCIWIRC